jgi:purine-binding chemotaxis protein CheW
MNHESASQSQSKTQHREYLSFALGEAEYGIDILKVREIRGYDAATVTHITDVPPYVKGIINLRGVIVPILDLRIRFDLAHIEYNQQTVVVILNVHSRTIGVVVDSVSDVLQLRPDQISDAPQFGSGISTRFLTGIATVQDRMLILVDIELLMSDGEFSAMEEALA